SNDFRIRIARIGMLVDVDTLAKLPEILDDPVMDNGESSGTVEMRVSVLVSHAAVRRPASVAEADGCLGQRWIVADNAPCLLLNLDRSVDANRDPPGVIAAVLEFS